MEADPLAPYRHSHEFRPDTGAAEAKTRRVIVLNAAMMALELFAGWRFHSMALLADGWHMGTHVAAFLLAAGAYSWARRARGDPRFSFGTGKIDSLAGYTSAIILGSVAAVMVAESVARIFAPVAIHYNEALGIGVVGLLVNMSSAWMLRHDHSAHGHSHGHGDGHGHSHAGGHDDHDLNLKAAYVHVIADAVTSVLAISALLTGKYLGWRWMDPVMGIVGAGVVAQWAWGLLGQTGTILLDRMPATDLEDEIRKAVAEEGEGVITDLHIWQLSSGQFSAIVAIATTVPVEPERYRQRLREHAELRHVTIEVNPVAAT